MEQKIIRKNIKGISINKALPTNESAKIIANLRLLFTNSILSSLLR